MHYADGGPGRLTPRRISFVRLALRADCFLLRGLVLAVLPPLFQLEINELPHHPGLRQADSCQTSHPKRETMNNIFSFFLLGGNISTVFVFASYV